MAISFRILDQDPVYFDEDGIPVANGSLSFFQAGTTTPQNVYEDPALTINNGPVIPLGPDGRATLETWGTGAYRVRLYAADATLIWDRDNVQIPGSGGLTIPTPVANDFLTNDGTNLLWQPIVQVPDVTGNSGKFLGNDGVNPSWQTITFPSPAITVASNGVGGITATAVANVGGLKLMIQTGTGSIPASGINQANGTITFATAFSAAPVVSVTLTTTSSCASGFPCAAATSIGTTGCGVSFNNSRDAASGGAITGTVTYEWTAIGLSP